MRWRSWWRWAIPAGALLCVAMAGSGALRAAGPNAFEACLDAQAKAWIDARAALVLHEDPAAGDIDDRAVAAWTAQTLSTCAAKAGRGNDASERLFGRYMAHWREHIDAAVSAVRRRLPPD